MVRTGFHFSESFYIGFMGSQTGGCRIEMQTYPFLQTTPKISITVGVKHFSDESHFGWLIWKLVGEVEGSFIEASFERCTFWSLETYSPLEQISIYKTHRNRQIALTFLRHYVSSHLTLELLLDMQHCQFSIPSVHFSQIYIN